jgi:hypothetical protein
VTIKEGQFTLASHKWGCILAERERLLLQKSRRTQHLRRKADCRHILSPGHLNKIIPHSLRDSQPVRQQVRDLERGTSIVLLDLFDRNHSTANLFGQRGLRQSQRFSPLPDPIAKGDNIFHFTNYPAYLPLVSQDVSVKDTRGMPISDLIMTD